MTERFTGAARLTRLATPSASLALRFASLLPHGLREVSPALLAELHILG